MLVTVLLFFNCDLISSKWSVSLTASLAVNSVKFSSSVFVATDWIFESFFEIILDISAKAPGSFLSVSIKEVKNSESSDFSHNTSEHLPGLLRKFFKFWHSFLCIVIPASLWTAKQGSPDIG